MPRLSCSVLCSDLSVFLSALIVSVMCTPVSPFSAAISIPTASVNVEL